MHRPGSALDQDEPIAEMNLIPLIDIALTLLIILMVTTAFVRNPGVNLNLPKTVTREGNPETDKDLTISVAANGAKKPVMTATQYLAYVVKQSAGAMKKTPVGGVSDYLDFGNGKEDGVGSTAKAGSLRLDAWVAGKYVILTFSAPAVATPPAPLLAFIKSTQTLL